VWVGSTAQTLTARFGTTPDLTGWTLQSAVGISDDGKTSVGYGLHNDVPEGWIARLP
jgi:hypothetical protein